MNITELIVLSPLILLAATPVLILLVLAGRRDHRLTVTLTLAGLLVTFLSTWAVSSGVPQRITPLLVMDRFSLFYIALLVLTAAVVALLSYGYLDRLDEPRDEFYVLLLLATLGGATLVASVHFASFFLGLEVLSVSLYAMIAYTRTRERAVEAGLKYLILAGTSSAFLLFGMALVYAALGTMYLPEVARLGAAGGRDLWLLSGMGMIMVGAGFKLAVVPFHMWTPDVYEGAPAPTTAFIATASKGAMIGLLARYFTELNIYRYPALLFLLALIAIASMFGGNLLALMQGNVKRILAYSSIAHLGYMLVALLAGGAAAVEAVTIYLVAYTVTSLAAFGVVTVLSGPRRDRDGIEEYRGLFWHRPWLAVTMAAALFSLAGIPLTAGFVGKFIVLVAGARSNLWILLVLLVVSSVIGLFYYLRLILVMVDRARRTREETPALMRGAWSWAGGTALLAVVVALLWVGVAPNPLIEWIRAAVAGLAL